MMKAIVQPTFKRYPAYKDSGVEWLGEIPEGWGSLKMKLLFRDFSEKGRPNAILLSVTQNKGVIPRETVENRMVMPTGNLDTFKYIQRGDFAISLRSFEGGLELCHSDGIISPAYTVLKAKRNLVNQYFKYLFKSFSFISEIQTSVVGIREGKNISFSELSYSILPLPTLNEQQTIARFLDEKTAQIDNAIAIKERQIAVLKERQQVLIQQAVTKGLDPDVPMKDSGVEWIGEIPAHWEVKRLRRIGRTQNGISKDGRFFGHGSPFLTYSDVYNNLVIPNKLGGRVETNLDEQKAFSVIEGDIFFTRTSETMEEIGLCATSFKNYDNSTFAGFLIRFRPKKGYLIKEYSKFFFSSHIHRFYFIKEMNLVTRASLSQELLKELIVILPPIKEQEMISQKLEKIERLNGELIQKLNLEIEKLKEYKTSLIDRVVTGKVKVF